MSHLLEDYIHERNHHVPNTNLIESAQLTTGQRIADTMARELGSWRFIICQSVVLTGWIVLNVVGWIRSWDPYPFIFLNLALSFQAAYSAPILMMSQNRQAARDRLTAEHDYEINVRAELEVAKVYGTLDALVGQQWDTLLQLQSQQLVLLQHIDALTIEVHRISTGAAGKSSAAGGDGPKANGPSNC